MAEAERARTTLVGRSQWLARLVVPGVAGAAAGSVIWLWWQLLMATTMVAAVIERRLRWDGLAFVLVAVVAYGLGTYVRGRPRRTALVGWTATAGAMSALAVVLVVNGAGHGTTGTFIRAVLLGLALGGVVLAASSSPGPARLAVVVGLVGGIAVAPWLTFLGGLTAQRHWLLPVAAAALAVSAGLSARHYPPRLEYVRGPQWSPLLAVGIVGAGVWVVTGVRVGLLESLLHGGSPASARRIEVVETADRLALLAVVVVLVTGLAAYAFRLGGRDPARWVVVGASMAFVVTGSSEAVAESIQVDLAAVAVGMLAVAMGGLAVVRAGRIAPWDAVGVLCSAAALAVLGFADQSRTVAAGAGAGLVLTGLIAFTLAAGVAVAARSAFTRGRGLVVAVVLGLASLAYVTLLTRVAGLAAGDASPMAFPGMMIVGGVAVTVLWLLGRFVVVRRTSGLGAHRLPPRQPSTGLQ